MLVVDTAHGHSRTVIETVRRIKAEWDVQVIAGNVATARGRRGADRRRRRRGQGRHRPGLDLHDAGRRRRGRAADHRDLRLRRGGVPARRARDRRRRHPSSGDIAKALAAGADSVMLGGLLAGIDESPGEVILYQGERFKEYRGMGSLGAMKARSFSKDRYFQGDVRGRRQARARGHRGPRPVQGPARGRSSTSSSAASGRRWATAARRRSRRSSASALRPHHRRRPAREPPARRHDHQGSAELPAAVVATVHPLPRSASPPPRSGRCWCWTSAASTRS